MSLLRDLFALLEGAARDAAERRRALVDEVAAAGARGKVPGAPGLGETFGWLMERAVSNNLDIEATRRDLRGRLRASRVASAALGRVVDEANTAHRGAVDAAADGMVRAMVAQRRDRRDREQGGAAS